MLAEAQGHLKDAEPLFREVLQGRRQVLGDQHPDTLASINNLATLLQASGRLEEAEPLYREAIERRLPRLDEAEQKASGSGSPAPDSRSTRVTDLVQEVVLLHSARHEVPEELMYTGKSCDSNVSSDISEKQEDPATNDGAAKDTVDSAVPDPPVESQGEAAGITKAGTKTSAGLLASPNHQRAAGTADLSEIASYATDQGSDHDEHGKGQTKHKPKRKPSAKAKGRKQ